MENGGKGFAADDTAEGRKLSKPPKRFMTLGKTDRGWLMGEMGTASPLRVFDLGCIHGD
jgi:hypothetical protein